MEQLHGFMFDFSQMSRRERVVQRNRTERLSELLDWKNLGSYYSRARNLAMQKAFPEMAEERRVGGVGGGGGGVGRRVGDLVVPRPYSAPGSRAASPDIGSEDEEEEEEEEDEK